MKSVLTSLAEVVAFVAAEMGLHPECDGKLALHRALAGQRRPSPVMSIQYGDPSPLPAEPENAPAIPELHLPSGPERELAVELLNGLKPLRLGNPVSGPGFGLGRGTGTLATLFGIPLNPDCKYAPAFNRSIADILAEPPPDVAQAGLMPEMHERITRIKAACPPGVTIHLPDIQGPFNVAHMVAGEEVLLAPLTDPELFARFMARITDAWIEAVTTLYDWIGPAYGMAPADRIPRLRECSVNLISPALYRQFVLPCDLRVAEVFPQLELHPCSGRHVFEVTLEHLPVVITEAGWMEGLAAPWMPVDEALVQIGDRPIVLRVFEDLPDDGEAAWKVIEGHLARYADTPRLLFSFFSKRWTHAQRPLMRELHRRANACWKERYG